MELRDIKHTVQIHTNTSGVNCEVCRKSLSWGPGTPIADAINHYLAHDYVLLHVGSEWGPDMDGKSVSYTVAILGR